MENTERAKNLSCLRRNYDLFPWGHRNRCLNQKCSFSLAKLLGIRLMNVKRKSHNEIFVALP